MRDAVARGCRIAVVMLGGLGGMMAAASIGAAQPLEVLDAGTLAGLPPQRRSAGGKYMTARAAHAAITAGRAVLIDIRTPEETAFGGLPAPATRHIPYMLMDDTFAFDERAGRYKLAVNPDFGKAVELLLADLKLDRSATLILMCSVGERSAAAASFLTATGYPNVIVMIGGSDGDGGLGPLGRGWREEGLPWAARMRLDQVYRSPSF